MLRGNAAPASYVNADRKLLFPRRVNLGCHLSLANTDTQKGNCLLIRMHDCICVHVRARVCKLMNEIKFLIDAI